MSHSIVRRLVVVPAAAILLAAAGLGRLAAATSDCPRNCEVWAYGYQEPEPGTYRKIRDVKILQTIAKDGSFTRGIFLEHFSQVFSGSRLMLDAKDKPEYSLTATFTKIIELNTSKPYSVLTVALGFSGGKIGSGHGSFYWIAEDFSGDLENPDYRKFRNDIPCHYHRTRLRTWLTVSEGYDIAAHVPLMAAQVKASEINGILTQYEQIPVNADFEKTPYWCDQQGPDATLQMQIDGLKAATYRFSEFPYAHMVRIVIRADKGVIEDGVACAEDPKARVFTFSCLLVDGKSPIPFQYTPPEGEDHSDVITIYNSCEIRGEDVVPLSETKKGSMLLEIENQCGWEGTLTMSETMQAGEKGSLLAALTPGGKYDIAKNWGVRFKLRRETDAAGRFRYAVDEARLLSFKEALEATMFMMEREGRRIEGTSKQGASSRGRSLSKGECDLDFIVDTNKGTYRLWGKIDVQGISIQGRDEIEIKVKPIDEAHGEAPGGTTGIDEQIEITGTFDKSKAPEGVPEELKGRKDLMQEVPAEFRQFLEDLGGKQKYIMTWELKRKAVRVTKG